MDEFTVEYVNSDDMWKFKDFLLDADPSEEMVNKYLSKSKMIIMKKIDDVVAEAVIEEKSNFIIEIKNIAVAPSFQKKGLGKLFIQKIENEYKNIFNNTYHIIVGTSKYGQGFYEKCGFKYTHTVFNFFTDNYPMEIMENGERIVDMYYLEKIIKLD